MQTDQLSGTTAVEMETCPSEMIKGIEKDSQFYLYMFVTLAQQAEGWGYMLKGKVNRETKFKLENYLLHSKAFFNHIKDSIDYDDIIDAAEFWSDIQSMFKSSDIETKKKLLLLLQQVVVESKKGKIKNS